MKVGLVGYFGYGNYGDEIFLELWKDLFGKKNVQVIFPNDSLEGIDKIVIGGGDLIHPTFVNNNYFREEFFQKDVYIYGVSVPLQIKGKDPVAIEKYKQLFSRAKYLSVRDGASAKWLSTNQIYSDIKVVEDMAWCFEPNVNMPKTPHIAGITYRHCQIPVEEMMMKCWYLYDRGYKHFLLIPLQEGYYSTREYSMVLKERLKTITPYVNITPLSDIEHKFAYINSVGLFITTAFHGLITALSGGTKVMSILDDSKFVQLSQRFGLSCTRNLSEFGLEYDNKVKDESIWLHTKERTDIIKKDARVQLDNFRGIVCG